jgi:hypothetical protein
MLSTEKIIPGISDNKAFEPSCCIFLMLPRWKNEMQNLDVSALVRRHHHPLRLSPPQICGRFLGIMAGYFLSSGASVPLLFYSNCCLCFASISWAAWW